MKLVLLKNVSIVVHFTYFFSLGVQRVEPSWVRIEKKKKSYLRHRKIKKWENLIIQRQNCLQSFFLPKLDSTCLNDSIVIKIKKPYIETQRTRFLWDFYLGHSFSLDTDTDATYDNYTCYDRKSSILWFLRMSKNRKIGDLPNSEHTGYY